MCGSISSVEDGEHHPTILSSSKQTMSAINNPPPIINEVSEDVETNNKVYATAFEFETFVDNRLDGLYEPYPFQQDGDGYSGAKKYSIQTINNDEPSTTNSRFYKGRFEFKIKRSGKERFEAGCKNDSCVFKLGAVKMREEEYWQIQKYNKEHSCTIDVLHARFQQASAWVIGELYSLKLQVNDTTLKPIDIMTEMQLEYGLQVFYTKAWRARDYAESIVFGPAAKSF
ncbi:hypothetical protein Dsin_019651 [Dipteronia sinensis]|uniref:Transposase MuDR plant domain-containing protein n=1 Tax=Dipteronia sinensis TaxID=43782 RepID=A0AAE0A7N8_9ROSI|nr:hypothetical protein Dsin_019651 [Dipteronia sinensis]